MTRLFFARLTAFLLAGVIASAADLTGIWTGQIQGRNNEMDDISFRFKQSGTTLTGTLFGDEFDLAIEEGSITGDQVRLIVTSTNYYSGNKTSMVYTGQIKGNEITFTVERLNRTGEAAPNRPFPKRTFTLKRLI